MSGYTEFGDTAPAPEISEEEDRAGFHEAAFLAALTGVCANPEVFLSFRRLQSEQRIAGADVTSVEFAIVEAAKPVADIALDAYPFITDDEQLTKGKTQ